MVGCVCADAVAGYKADMRRRRHVYEKLCLQRADVQKGIRLLLQRIASVGMVVMIEMEKESGVDSKRWVRAFDRTTAHVAVVVR